MPRAKTLQGRGRVQKQILLFYEKMSGVIEGVVFIVMDAPFLLFWVYFNKQEAACQQKRCYLFGGFYEQPVLKNCKK
jgi:hypothetical protein